MKSSTLFMGSITHTTALDEVNTLLHTPHGHEHEHDRNIRDGVREHAGRVSDLDPARVGGADVDVVWG
jgi:hypothetical protein